MNALSCNIFTQITIAFGALTFYTNSIFADEGRQIVYSHPIVSREYEFLDHSTINFVWGAVNDNSSEQIRRELTSTPFLEIISRIQGGMIKSTQVEFEITDPTVEKIGTISIFLNVETVVSSNVIKIFHNYIDLRRSGFSSTLAHHIIGLPISNSHKGAGMSSLRDTASYIFGGNTREAFPEMLYRAHPFLELRGSDVAYFMIDRDATWFLVFKEGMVNIFGADTDQVFDREFWNYLQTICPTYTERPIDFVDLLNLEKRILDERDKLWVTPFSDRPLWLVEFIQSLSRNHQHP